MFGKYQDMALMQKQLNKQKLLQLQHQRMYVKQFLVLSHQQKKWL